MFDNIDKQNLHHAYLIEGEREILLPQILAFIEELGVSTVGNPDFSHIITDSFRIDDARNLRSLGVEKSGSSGKRIFLISANNFLIEAQNTLLKIFEEPIENTHFFVLVPDKNTLIKTLFSRLYFLSGKSKDNEDIKQIDKFIKMSLPARIEFIKGLLAETEEEADEEIITQNSARARANSFLNSLEYLIHKNYFLNYEHGRFTPEEGGRANKLQSNLLEHIMKVRGFLRMPGASAKNLMESVAILIPNL
jgi:hypothetical protein